EAASPPVRPAFESSGGAVDLAFEPGWDYAHHGVTPPAERLQRLERSRGVEQGYRAGRALFGMRTLHADRFVRKWLQLRLGALERGRAFDCQGATPRYLASIDVACCPIVRESLTHQCQLPSDWSIDRVDNRSDYVAGNLAVISVRANKAKH